MATSEGSLDVVSQTEATTILGPCAIGWSLQLILGGMATALAGSLLLSKGAKVARLSKPLLGLAMLMNLGAMAVTAAEIWQYMTSNDRSQAKFDTYTFADCVAPLFAGLTAATCQIFMGLRCLKLAGNRKWVAVIIGAGILVSLGGAIWLTIANFLFVAGKLEFTSLLAPTELTLWAPVTVDVLLTAILSWNLRKMKAGFNKSTDEFITSLIRLSFETCAAPLFFSVVTAVLYAATFNDIILWNLFNAPMAPIPPLYLISVCYCLRASASRHKKMKESTFLPTSALWNQQMSQISQRGSTVPGRVGQQPTQPKKADKSANRSESASFGTISQEDGHIRPPLTSRTTGFPIEAYFADGSKTHRPPSVSRAHRSGAGTAQVHRSFEDLLDRDGEAGASTNQAPSSNSLSTAEAARSGAVSDRADGSANVVGSIRARDFSGSSNRTVSRLPVYVNVEKIIQVDAD